MKSLGEVLSLSITYLQEKKVASPRRIVETLLMHILKKDRLDLYMQFECPLEEEELKKLREALKRASLHEPIEYILSQVEFYGSIFELTSDVLIPRPETEILVDKALGIIESEIQGGEVVWDVCTGSGCIGISIKKKIPSLAVTLSDVSSRALSLAKKNARAIGVDVEYKLGDLLAPFSGQKAKYIFCNPPYITEEEYRNLDSSVRDYEPKLALVGGKEGIEMYKRLSEELASYLLPGGKVFFEIGTGQGERLCQLFSAHCWIKRDLFFDYAGHERFFFLEIE
jgi:release factor glutamine methyltransferase